MGYEGAGCKDVQQRSSTRPWQWWSIMKTMIMEKNNSDWLYCSSALGGTLKPVLCFPHKQSGRIHRQRGLLVFILPKAYAGGLLRRRVPYMCSRLAWTVKQTTAQSYCTSGWLYIVLPIDCTGSGSNRLLHTACVCAVGAFVAYWLVIKNGRHADVHAHPPMPIFTSHIP